MLPSPMYLKLYLEITNLDWDSFVLQTDGESNPGGCLQKSISWAAFHFPGFTQSLWGFKYLLFFQIYGWITRRHTFSALFCLFIVLLIKYQQHRRRKKTFKHTKDTQTAPSIGCLCFERRVPFFLTTGINLLKGKRSLPPIWQSFPQDWCQPF